MTSPFVVVKRKRNKVNTSFQEQPQEYVFRRRNSHIQYDQSMHIRITFSALLFFVMISISSCDPSTMQGILNGTSTTPSLTNAEVIEGLKSALEIGANQAVSTTSALDGFWKNPTIRIPFPAEAEKVKSKALQLGLNNQVQSFEQNMNRAAERAAKEATSVLLNAIKNMSIEDGFAILKGDSIAATTFLKQKTTAELTQKFSPIVQKAIDDVSLTSYYEPLATAYNTATILTGGKAVNPDLNAYITEKALQGLFHHISLEEKKIRKDPAARVTAILQKVFGSVNK